MPHSIPQNTGLVIETPAGRILHTGDFKLGLKGPEQGRDVLDRLSKAADGKVDLMIADSTGSEEEESAGEETTVADTLDRLVKEARGRVFTAVFSSNVRRIESVLAVAKKHGRKVTMCGRSVQTHVRVASSTCGINIPPGLVIPMEDAVDLPRDRVLVLVSGTQGEPRSALSRLAVGSHHVLDVDKDDLVVLSSRFIPGNELAIGRMIDNLLRTGARVVHRGVIGDVHVSGHGSKNEIRAAIQAVRPRCFLPAHGTLRHLMAAANLAREAGVTAVAVATDGQAVRCGSDGLSVQECRDPVRRVFIDGGSGLAENAIKDRRILSAHGVLVVSFAIDKNGKLAGSVDTIARGVTKDEALPWLADQIDIKVKELMDRIDPSERSDPNQLRDSIRSSLRKYVSKLLSREPYVLVSVLKI